MELGHQNKQRISSNVNGVIAIKQFNPFRGASACVQQQNRSAFNCVSTGLCRGCGQNLTPTQLQVCPPLGKKGNHSGLLKHFAKVCRKKKQNSSKNIQQSKRINHVENSENTEQSDIQNVNFINNL